MNESEEYEGVICPQCNGSGEGMYDGTICVFCGGSGVEWVYTDEEEPEDE